MGLTTTPQISGRSASPISPSTSNAQFTPQRLSVPSPHSSTRPSTATRVASFPDPHPTRNLRTFVSNIHAHKLWGTNRPLLAHKHILETCQHPMARVDASFQVTQLGLNPSQVRHSDSMILGWGTTSKNSVGVGAEHQPIAQLEQDITEAFTWTPVRRILSLEGEPT
ncbi:hypothetical protein K474DRAFT_1713584 [Panus rudis PR-1116 ss-1]|nr:hypothetical protein K474DRAFT_1713584 [Panus rudis PR-1116 ss-1]